MKISKTTLVLSWLMPFTYAWLGYEWYQFASTLEWTEYQKQFCLTPTDSHWAFGVAFFSLIGCIVLSFERFRNKQRLAALGAFYMASAIYAAPEPPYNFLALFPALALLMESDVLTRWRKNANT